MFMSQFMGKRKKSETTFIVKSFNTVLLLFEGILRLL